MLEFLFNKVVDFQASNFTKKRHLIQYERKKFRATSISYPTYLCVQGLRNNSFSKNLLYVEKVLSLNVATSWFIENCKKHWSCSTACVINFDILYFINSFTKLTNTCYKSTVKSLYLLWTIFCLLISTRFEIWVAWAHFGPMFHFFTHILMLSRGIEMEHWVKIG